MKSFPRLENDLDAKSALRVVNQHEATGAVIRTHDGHAVIAWGDIADAAAQNQDRPLADVHAIRIEESALVPADRDDLVMVLTSSLPEYSRFSGRFTTIGAKQCPNQPRPFPCRCTGACPY